MKQGILKLSRAVAFASCSAALITACGGSSSGGSNSSSFSLGVTDAPVDAAAKVVVSFTGVSLKPADGEAVEFVFDEAKSIDLLELQGENSAALVTDETVPAGEYTWLRLHVEAEQDNVMDSYVELEDGTQVELRVPSGAQSGLKLNGGFVMPAGGAADFTIDFDLRKSLTDPRGQDSITLKPSLRMVNNVEVGSISGTVDTEMVLSVCEDPAMDAGAVYVYSGSGVLPMDVRGAETDPLASALVSLDGEAYVYEVGFVPAGSYTVAYTCEASMDDPEAEDVIVFEMAADVDVSAGLPSVFDFIPVVP